MSLYARVRSAMSADSSIAVAEENVDKAAGSTTGYLKSLGLTKGDLTKLESLGLAIRGYRPSRRGHQVRWVLINRGGA